jgi:hypothetical protein
MNNTQKIYFVISGVREGFKRTHILCNNNIAEVLDYIDDRRQVSNSAKENFYSVEKTPNYTLATIYNPNTIDQVGRKAYIAITLFVNNNYTIGGNIFSALKNLMDYYIVKQGNELANRFTAEMFEQEYSHLNLNSNPRPGFGVQKKQGYFIYNDEASIIPHFETLSITGFQKVYFLNNSNLAAIDQLHDFEKITAFQGNVFIEIPGFNQNLYNIKLNNHSYAPLNIAGNDIKIFGVEGDQLLITNLSTRNQKEINFTSQNRSLSIYTLFPEDKPENQRSKITEVAGNSGGMRQKGGGGKKDKGQKTMNLLLLTAFLALFTVIGIFNRDFILGEKGGADDGGSVGSGDTTIIILDTIVENKPDSLIQKKDSVGPKEKDSSDKKDNKKVVKKILTKEEKKAADKKAADKKAADKKAADKKAADKKAADKKAADKKAADTRDLNAT